MEILDRRRGPAARDGLGCDHRPASAIEWALEQHEEIIVLEDDCVPHPDFFRFVAAMLERYRDDDRVMLISGINVLKGRRTLPYSYAFSRYYLTWGWATWRRSWKRYDFAIKKWPEIRDAGLLWDLLGDKREVEYWTKAFEDVWHHKIDAWDFQLHLAMWLHQAYAIYPASNLITNIGVEGTHYSVALPTQNIATTELPFPLHHPPAIYRDIRADELIRSTWYLPPLGEQFRRKARRAIKRLRRS